jgi:hypothetical protein
MKAMHAICHHVDNRPDHFHSDGELGRYRSGIWKLEADEASGLKGGWLYLHETSKQRAYLRAKIESVEGPDAEGKYWLVVRKQPKTGNVAWRGAAATSSSYVRVVDATLPIEVENAST